MTPRFLTSLLTASGSNIKFTQSTMASLTFSLDNWLAVDFTVEKRLELDAEEGLSSSMTSRWSDGWMEECCLQMSRSW